MLPSLISLLIVLASSNAGSVLGIANVPQTSSILASHVMPLNDRYGNSFVNTVFKDNILLTMSYLDGAVKSKNDINWDNVEKPFSYQFTLNPGEEFAFHTEVLANYSKNIVKTTNAHFNYDDGFKSDGYLTGDGVCHLASLFYWVAKDANLVAYAPTNHNFAVIPDIPKEYGVAIFDNPATNEGGNSNLYIINTKDKPVTFVFNYANDNLTASVIE